VHVVIAPDTFGGTLTALQAAAAISEGWLRGAPHDTVTAVPLSDGGPGFVDVIAAALPEAVLTPVTVEDPFGRPVPATLLSHDGVVYVESAQACGLHLIPPAERDLIRATTRGVGQLLAAALAMSPTKVVVGLGGSATHDGGRGAVEVLASTWPAGVELVIATDVDARLDEAAYFAAQKGASEEQLPVPPSSRPRPAPGNAQPRVVVPPVAWVSVCSASARPGCPASAWLPMSWACARSSPPPTW
jgi:glycerate kinase